MPPADVHYGWVKKIIKRRKKVLSRRGPQNISIITTDFIYQGEMKKESPGRDGINQLQREQ
jgi:hypothetical protein